MMQPSSRSSTPVPFLTSDLEDEERLVRANNDAIAQVLNEIGNLLNNADHALEDVERNSDMLGSAIIRRCQELADVISDVVNDLDQQSDAERRALARACLQDAQDFHNDLQLSIENNDNDGHAMLLPSSEMSSMSEDDMMLALSGTQSLLKDVEASLRSISRDEADEIADVALILARLFLTSIQSFHATIVDSDITTVNRGLPESDRVELLDDDDDDKDYDEDAVRGARAKPKLAKRVRVLWPPLGPAVASACQWAKDAATKQPVLAVAMGLTLWPAAVVTAMIGTPVVLVDHFAQQAYNNWSEAPLIQQVEQGAAQVYHAGRLSLLCSGLVYRQTLRVAKRQLDRHGGPGKVAQDLGDMAMDRAMHPVETISMAWDGIVWSIGSIRDFIVASQDMVSNNNSVMMHDY